MPSQLRVTCTALFIRLASSLGIQSLSLLKNRTYTLNKIWSDGLLAAHAPYLVTMNKATIVLWDRKLLVHFSVSKEPFIKKIIILAENLQVPGKFSCGFILGDPLYLALLSVFY